MLKRQHSVRLGEDMPKRISPPHPRVPRKRRVFVLAACLGLFLVVLNLVSGQLSGTVAYAQAPATVHLKGASSTLNILNPGAGSTSHSQPYTPSAPGTQPSHSPVAITHTVPLPMKPGKVTLQVGKVTPLLKSVTILSKIQLSVQS